ncbi:MAG: glycoside hydrolase family 32 protein [Duncaniella sp.]|nr:glycoside hydrolase family 32 protein [Duncaniella sp.]
MIGWMSNWQYAPEVPTMQFRSANTLPREIGLFRDNDGEIYASSTPSPEVDALRSTIYKSVGKANINAKGQKYSIPELCEITMDIDPLKAESVSIELANEAGEKVIMIYNPSTSELSFDRKESGIVDFSQDFPAITVAPTHSDGKSISLRIFIDRSSIEVFKKDGRFAMTNLVFPNSPYSRMTVKSTGGNSRLSNLKIYNLNVD